MSLKKNDSDNPTSLKSLFSSECVLVLNFLLTIIIIITMIILPRLMVKNLLHAQCKRIHNPLVTYFKGHPVHHHAKYNPQWFVKARWVIGRVPSQNHHAFLAYLLLLAQPDVAELIGLFW